MLSYVLDNLAYLGNYYVNQVTKNRTKMIATSVFTLYLQKFDLRTNETMQLSVDDGESQFLIKIPTTPSLKKLDTEVTMKARDGRRGRPNERKNERIFFLRFNACFSAGHISIQSTGFDDRQPLHTYCQRFLVRRGKLSSPQKPTDSSCGEHFTNDVGSRSSSCFSGRF